MSDKARQARMVKGSPYCWQPNTKQQIRKGRKGSFIYGYLILSVQ